MLYIKSKEALSEEDFRNPDYWRAENESWTEEYPGLAFRLYGGGSAADHEIL